ncbi:MAG: helix-turn-helix domain-containing protein, partial [Candidatus Zixiibacteriota bacterium]
CQLQGFFEEYGGKLKPGAITVYFALNAEAEKWGTNSFFLSDEELTGMTGISRRTIPKHLKELESVGLVKYERHHGRHLATDYVVKPLGSAGKREEISRFIPEKREKSVKKREEISHHHDMNDMNDHDDFKKVAKIASFSDEKVAKIDEKVAKIATHHDHDMNDHDGRVDEKSKMIDVLHGMGVNGDGERWVEALGVKRMRELIEIAVSRATTNPGGYLRVLVDQEIIGGSTFQAKSPVALPIRDVKSDMIATHRRTGHQFRVKYAVAHRVVLEQLDKSGSFGIDEADLKDYDFE